MDGIVQNTFMLINIDEEYALNELSPKRLLEDLLKTERYIISMGHMLCDESYNKQSDVKKDGSFEGRRQMFLWGQVIGIPSGIKSKVSFENIENDSYRNVIMVHQGTQTYDPFRDVDR